MKKKVELIIDDTAFFLDICKSLEFVVAIYSIRLCSQTQKYNYSLVHEQKYLCLQFYSQVKWKYKNQKSVIVDYCQI